MKEDVPVSEYFKSETNQPFFNEIKMGVFGPGSIFGVEDVVAERANNYMIRSTEPNSTILVVPA